MEKKINLEKKKVILIVFSVFFIGLVSSLPPIPPLPDHFIGDVFVNNQNAPLGTEIKIYVDNTLKDTITTNIIGEYDLYVKTGELGDLIEFKISDILAGGSTRQGGETIILDLSITTSPSSSGSGSSGGSGGGGGGGSSGGSGGIISPPPTTIKESLSDTLENETQEQESENLEETSPGITGAVIGFLVLGKGIVAIIVLIILGIGVILIKFKPQKWKRN